MTSPAASPADVALGTILLGKYRVDAVVGQGGMGVVVQATHLGLDERVAIKFLRHDVAQLDGAMARFLREAQAAAKLKSEHVARVMDVGTFEGGAPYMIMEFLDGIDLGAMLAQHGRLAPALVAELCVQACVGLAEAHGLGIVHRDIKPENLFITWRPDGSPLLKLLDFGISKAAMGVDVRLTQTQSMLGTPAYMSPEQMRSARLVDVRSDQWSLGVVLYELAAGYLPFRADSFSELVVQVVSDPPAPLPADVPPVLAAIIARCLAKSPDDRFASIAEVGRALVPLVRDTRQAEVLVDRMQRGVVLASRRAATPAPVAAPSETPAPPAQPPVAEGGADPQLTALLPDRATIVTPTRPVEPRPARRRRVWLGVLVSALALAGVAVAVGVGRGGADGAHAPLVTPPAVELPQVAVPDARAAVPDARAAVPDARPVVPDARPPVVAPPIDAAPAVAPADAAPDARPRPRPPKPRSPQPGCDPADILNCRDPKRTH